MFCILGIITIDVLHLLKDLKWLMMFWSGEFLLHVYVLLELSKAVYKKSYNMVVIAVYPLYVSPSSFKLKVEFSLTLR